MSVRQPLDAVAQTLDSVKISDALIVATSCKVFIALRSIADVFRNAAWHDSQR